MRVSKTQCGMQQRPPRNRAFLLDLAVSLQGSGCKVRDLGLGVEGHLVRAGRAGGTGVTPSAWRADARGGQRPSGQDRRFQPPPNPSVLRFKRLVFDCRTTSASTAPCTSRRVCCPTHCASYCAPCQPLLRAFFGWIRSPPSTPFLCFEFQHCSCRSGYCRPQAGIVSQVNGSSYQAERLAATGVEPLIETAD